jgi:hypothetical protein
LETVIALESRTALYAIFLSGLPMGLASAVRLKL